MPRYASTIPIANAIAQMEGFTSGKSIIARQNNNPGNIRYWAPGLQINGGFTVFPSLAAGWAALYELIDDYTDGPQGVPPYFSTYPTLLEMFQRYAPAGDGSNNPVAYAQMVGAQIGLPIDVPVATGIPTGSVQPGNGIPSDNGQGTIVDPTPFIVNLFGTPDVYDETTGELLIQGSSPDPRYVLGAVMGVGVLYLLLTR